MEDGRDPILELMARLATASGSLMGKLPQVEPDSMQFVEITALVARMEKVTNSFPEKTVPDPSDVSKRMRY